jgi:hypothetical protein
MLERRATWRPRPGRQVARLEINHRRRFGHYHCLDRMLRQKNGVAIWEFCPNGWPNKQDTSGRQSRIDGIGNSDEWDAVDRT